MTYAFSASTSRILRITILPNQSRLMVGRTPIEEKDVESADLERLRQGVHPHIAQVYDFDVQNGVPME